MEVHAVFVAHEVTTGQVFLRLLRFYPDFITPEMLDYHSSICYLSHLILAVDNSVKYHFKKNMLTTHFLKVLSFLSVLGQNLG